TIDEGFDAFFADGSIARGEVWRGEIGGFRVVTAPFAIASSDGPLSGLIGFLDHDGKVLAMVALGRGEAWQAHADAVAEAFTSFRRLTEPALRDVSPMRVEVVPLSAETTLKAFDAEQSSVVTIEELAVLNHVEPDRTLPAGRLVKRVVGFNPARYAQPR